MFLLAGIILPGMIKLEEQHLFFCNPVTNLIVKRVLLSLLINNLKDPTESIPDAPLTQLTV